ncbi:hypothetical protein EXT73_06025 [Pectobacterium atrosepticum]|nr:hypothetical protein EV46_13765 [Pectobacterium atrosepticum]KMK79415.1 hypothetical protein KCQ_18652 [Pectobacterium atrosepticum ICMP 1526]MCL6408414.1 hypothetical protein [Dickeya dadantii]ATY90453.1 hypothetical protein CVS35_08880 [Pectobacterium atrosepticum]KFX16328.1 hypothetical protein JV34_05935 [Pectobacterium atrosepticum]
MLAGHYVSTSKNAIANGNYYHSMKLITIATADKQGLQHYLGQFMATAHHHADHGFSGLRYFSTEYRVINKEGKYGKALSGARNRAR